MADTVDVKQIYNSPRQCVYQFTNESDGTGENGVKKIDKSTLTGPNGAEPTGLSLMEVSWSVSSGYVVLEWDHTTPDEIVVCTGDGTRNYEFVGGNHDPGSSGGAGDILLTTDGFADGDGYTITTWWKKKD